MRRTLVIFDVDGTLVEAAMDNDSFDRALQEIGGVTMTAAIWSQFTEVTAEAIVRQALGGEWPNLPATAGQIRDLFLANLRSSHGSDPESIRAADGADTLLSDLRVKSGLSVAIATGCWRETAHFKLNAAGFDFADIPFASASDCYSRTEIISLAAERAGIPVEQAVYVGDGVWDLRATQKLGIPFIGVGRNVGALREAGAEYTLEVLSAATLAEVVGRI